jgi:hypothetical protein
MGRHGRQQLLSSSSRGRKGQAIIELLPAVIIFFTVVVAALNYFRVMRAAVIRQESARNALFAVISNSGTLTTPPNLLQDPRGQGMTPNGAGLIEGGAGNANNVLAAPQFVGADARCFSVTPPELNLGVETKLMPMFSSGGTPTVKILTYAVINRSPGGNCGY